MSKLNVGVLLATSFFVSTLGLAEPDDFQLPPAPIHKAAPAQTKPEVSYEGLDEAADAFITDWFTVGERPMPKLGVAVHREVDGDRYKLVVISQNKQRYQPDNRRWSWHQNQSPFRGGYWERGRWPQADGELAWRSESQMTFDPRSRKADTDRNFAFSARSERRSPDGFDRETSYTRSYSRTQTSPNPAPREEIDEEVEPRPFERPAAAVKPPVQDAPPKANFERDPIGRLFFYDNQEDWESVKSQLKTQRRLLHAGNTPDGLRYYVLIK